MGDICAHNRPCTEDDQAWCECRGKSGGLEAEASQSLKLKEKGGRGRARVGRDKQLLIALAHR